VLPHQQDLSLAMYETMQARGFAVEAQICGMIKFFAHLHAIALTCLHAFYKNFMQNSMKMKVNKY
jgi:hypothetical protein